MRSLIVPLCSLFLLAVGCDSRPSSGEAAEATEKTARSSNGAPSPASVFPEKEPGIIQDGDHPGPGGPGDLDNPRPAVGTATCVVASDDGDGHEGDGDGQKTTPKKPGGPTPIDPSTTRTSVTKPPTIDTSKTASRIDWSARCSSQVDADSCVTLCEAKGLRWDSSAGNEGTCFETTSQPSSTSSSGFTTSTECGCMCK